MNTKETQYRVFGRKEDSRDRQQQNEGDLATVAREFKQATDEVRTLGKQVLADNEAGKKSTNDLIGKVDDSLTKQGEMGQKLMELEQVVARGLKSIGAGDAENLGDVLNKFLEDNPDVKGLLANPKLGKSVEIPMERKALLGSSPTGTALNYPGMQVGMVAPLVRRLTVRDLMMPGRTSMPVIFYPRETGFTGGPTLVVEGAEKPEFNLTIENITQTVKTIAHWSDISLQMLSDVSFIRSYIEGRMLYQLALVEENQLLNGSGVSGNLQGLYTAATAYVQPAGAIVTDEQSLDRLRLMMLQVELANAFATGVVMHPTNWANIELLKDGEMRYLFTNPNGTTTGRVWGRDVVATQAMTQGTALVGDFASHTQIFDREDANVAISFENKDNFTKNMATIRVEERLASAIYRPEALVKGSLIIA